LLLQSHTSSRTYLLLTPSHRPVIGNHRRLFSPGCSMLASTLFLRRGLNFQSFFTVGSLDTLSVRPRGNGLSPIFKTVPDCSMSKDETFCFEIPSFVAASKVSPLADLI